MSVRRTVAQSAAGLMLLAAIVLGPAVAFGAPGDGDEASDGGGGDPPPQTECSQDANQDYISTLTVSPGTVDPGQSISLMVQCFPDRGTAKVSVIDPGGTTEKELESEEIGPGGDYTWEYQVPDDADSGIYTFKISSEKLNDNRQFTVEVDQQDEDDQGGDDGDKGDDQDPPPDEDKDEDDSGTTPPPDGDGDNGQDSGDDDGDNGGDSGADDGQDPDGDTGDQGNGSGNGDDQGQDRDQGNDRNSGEESQQEDSSEGGDTNASEGRENAADRKPAPQPRAAPGSATNDFPAATPEPTADQKQSAALAALMTSLFANGVSSGEVGTAPDEARTVIDPSADASEIEVPADGASDAGGASEDGARSGATDSDALAATGSNLLVPAGVAGLAILAGAGLKIHQIRRDR